MSNYRRVEVCAEGGGSVSRSWDRLLWGVTCSGGDARDAQQLLGTGWDRTGWPGHHPDEPTRALLFCTRAQARAWCAAKMASYADRPAGDICRQWRFAPVRVRERVDAVK